MQINPQIIDWLDQQKGHEEAVVGRGAALRTIANRAEKDAVMRSEMSEQGSPAQQTAVANIDQWSQCSRLASTIGDKLAHHFNLIAQQANKVQSLERAADPDGRQRIVQYLRSDSEDIGNFAPRVNDLMEMMDSHLTLINGDVHTIDMREAMLVLQEELRPVHELNRRYESALLQQMGPSLAPVGVVRDLPTTPRTQQSDIPAAGLG